ncbi:hypothetical protein O3M35_011792 [Rhynocoris fuscipes]|uniref:C2H2-type domain-containing protein n=1 Tax=Rhynocoris fuscipes TaxID=488301 RepID=A0AAW1CYU2_9HEMI
MRRSVCKISRPNMTMDIRRRCVETSSSFLNTNSSPGTQSPRSDHSPSPPITTVVTTPPTKPPVKRSFDVAFLMAPDDTSKKRHQEELKEQLRLVNPGNILQRYSPTLEKDTNRMVSPNYPESPIGLLMTSKQPIELDVQRGEQFVAKSAFTKVANPVIRIDNPITVSPNTSPAVSPDLSYQGSMSPPSRPRTPPQYYGKPVQYFPTTKPTITTPPYLYQPPVCRDKSRSSPPEEPFPGNFTKTPADDKGTTSKRVYPGDVLPYSGLAMAAAYPFPAAPFTGPAGTQVPALLTAAAANVTAALLPPSLAALTLPAQNICAKCNISFRMTSDLVYHMRSQHKSDHAMTDTRRRRDQDKLRCPVCNESFRERHHLTRHMTAHQDKDGDKVDDDEELTARRRITK